MQPIFVANDTSLHGTFGRYPAPLQSYLKKSHQDYLEFQQYYSEVLAWLVEYEFIPVFLLCVDGRVSDISTNAFGLRSGISHVIRSPGLQRCQFTNGSFARRFMKTVSRIQHMNIGGILRQKRILCFACAHYSSSHPNDGCAACNSDTELAIRVMKNAAREAQRHIGKRGVVLECLIDTDRDSVRIFGNSDTLDMADYLNETIDAALEREIRQRTIRLFKDRHIEIPQWETLVSELTEHLVNNIRFAQSTAHRPIELLTHQERLILIGGPLETTDHNAAFLIEKGDSLDMIEDLMIGLPIVGRNILQDALQNDTVPKIPILVSLDYDQTDDQFAISQVALGIIDRLKSQIQNQGTIMADAFSREAWWQQAPADFKRQIIEGENLVWVPAVYQQTVRQLQLVEY